MPTFSCPKCNKVLRTSGPIPAGKMVKCPGCASTFAPQVDEDERVATGIQNRPTVSMPARKAAPLPSRDEDDDDRPIRKKAAARYEDDDEDDARPIRRSSARYDDEDDEDRPRRKKKKKSSSGAGMGLFLLIGGVVLLLGGFGVTAFVWPGFLRSSGGASGPASPLHAFIPANSDFVVGMNLSSMSQKPGFRQGFEQGLMATGQINPSLLNLIKDADRGFVAGNAGTQNAVVGFISLSDLDENKVVQAFPGGAFESVQGKRILRRGMEFIHLADAKTFIFAKMPEPEFLKLLDSKTVQLPAEMANKINAANNAMAFGVVNLQVPAIQQNLNVAPMMMGQGAPKGLDQLLTILPRCKSIDFAMTMPNNGLKVQIGLQCANDADATQAETGVNAAWGQAKLMMAMVPLMPGGQQLGGALTELSKTFTVQRQGAAVSASAELSEKSLNDLQQLQGMMGQGFGPPGFGPPGFGPPGGPPGFQPGPPGMPPGFKGKMPPIQPKR
ncbi:MAG: hypothetical protein L0Y72_20070 [Gemmataceae bacterium]|nr:hypothetical protein [Gemmataceae bacterium]MCI0741334.1 hypothetical protein [Gemmataceae bacterium]